MNTIDSIRELFAHMQWADALCWKAVFDNPAALSDAKINERLLHIHLVQQSFLHVWRNDPFDWQAAADSNKEMRSLFQWARQYHTEVVAFVNNIDESAIESPMALPWQDMITMQFGQEAATPSLRETLIQVAMHSGYHRGQVATRLRELGAEPPLTDFIAWIWLRKPKAAWTTN